MNPRLILLLEYLGPAFSGSQRQANTQNTVQETLETALWQLNITDNPVILSGRTDAGVHAKGQVAHVDIAEDALDNIPDLVAALNAVLPNSIAIIDTALTPSQLGQGFHAIISAQWRWYRYRLTVRFTRSVWQRPDAAWIKQSLNVEKMREAAAYFIGEHDFTSFKCPQTEIENAVCNVIHSHISQDDVDIIFDVVANRFVYKMVRNLMGTLMDVGAGKIVPDQMPEILSRKNRVAAGRTAPPEGLSLMAVNYPESWGFFDKYVYGKHLKQITQEFSGHENVFCKAS